MLAKNDADRAVAVSVLEPVTSDAFYLSLTGQSLPKTDKRREAPSLSKEMIMTILNSNSNYAATPPAIRRAFAIFLARLARLINRWIAAVIAHREYQANLVVLRSFGDRELKDIGLSRDEIGEPLADAAKARLRKQRSERP
jgi:uncharacterized protein YjiS (DUF1127 family)